MSLQLVNWSLHGQLPTGVACDPDKDPYPDENDEWDTDIPKLFTLEERFMEGEVTGSIFSSGLGFLMINLKTFKIS